MHLSLFSSRISFHLNFSDTQKGEAPPKLAVPRVLHLFGAQIVAGYRMGQKELLGLYGMLHEADIHRVAKLWMPTLPPQPPKSPQIVGMATAVRAIAAALADFSPNRIYRR